MKPMKTLVVDAEAGEFLQAHYYPGNSPADGLLIGTNRPAYQPVILNREGIVKLADFLADCLAMEEE